VQCPTCGFDGLPGMKYCGQCGTRLGRVCAACGFSNPPHYRFCGECGAGLVEEPVPGESTAAAPTAPAPLPVAQVSVAPTPEPTELSEAQSLPLEGERRLATVVLADVTGSTDLLEQIGTEAWVEMMNRVLRLLESEVYRFGGEVDQFRGDGLVAFFGATSAHEDDPERAVLAGLAMQTALAPYAAELNAQQGIDVCMRVGVNTGELIVTSVGNRQQYREDTAMGEAIAIASRMETAAEPGTVLVSESTFRLVEAQFTWMPLGEITVKGLSQPITVYRPLAPQVDPGQTFGRAVPLIGRDAEFQTLKGRVDDVVAGRGGIVMLTGDKGMGKSLLVAEMRHHFARQGALLAEAHDQELPPPASLTWLLGRCRSYSDSWPFSMWLSMLRGWLGMRWGESQEITRERLRRQAELLWDDHLAEYYPYLATFLSLPLETPYTERIKHLDAEGWRQQLFFVLRGWVEAMAQRGPLVVTFADLQWADTTSLELLKYCLPLCDHEPLLWLIVFRPDRTSPVWGLRHHLETEFPHRLTTLALPALTEAQSEAFIDQLIGPDALPKETRDLVIRKAEGNPYYVRELIQRLIHQGVLLQESDTGTWRATRAVDSLDLPDSLHSLLLARIDRLSPEARHVLQRAAVVGPVFWSNVLHSLMEDGSRLREHLTALQRAGLIYERGRIAELGMEYVFTSNLVRDAAYESLLSVERSGYHRRVAEHLEPFFGAESLAHYYGLLAYHYRQADDLGKELFYALLAADQAKGIYANAEALQRYTRALELLEQMEAQASDGKQVHAICTQRFEVLSGRREVLFLTGDWLAARADAQALLQLAGRLEDDPVWLIDALLQQPGVAGWQTAEDLSKGTQMAAQALAMAQQLGDRRREMQSLVAIANQRLWTNDPTGWELAERALELARQLGDRNYEVSILMGMGRVYEWSDQPERGMAFLDAALPISQTLKDKASEIDLLYLIGLQFERSGDYYRLLTEYHQKRLHISREIGHRPAEAMALMQCGQIRGLYLGDNEGGLVLLKECLRILEGVPSAFFVWLRIAQMHNAQGKHAEAREALKWASRISGVEPLDGLENSSRTIVVPSVGDMGQAGLCLVAAMLYNARGDIQHLRQVLDLVRQTRQLVADAPLTRQYEMAAGSQSALAHLRLAELVTDEVQRQAHLRQALEASQAALEIYQQFGFVQVIECVSEEILYRHSLALKANGREAEAAETLQRAYDEMMRKYDLVPSDSPFRRTFLENIPLHREIRGAAVNSAEDIEMFRL
jgi:class 3 adenylate cyclase/tetratricopeptide (TPR) repeat protein